MPKLGRKGFTHPLLYLSPKKQKQKMHFAPVHEWLKRLIRLHFMDGHIALRCYLQANLQF